MSDIWSERLHGWRSRLFLWSRHPHKVALACVMILIGGFIGSMGIVGLLGVKSTELKTLFQDELAKVRSAPEHRDRELAIWLHDLLDTISQDVLSKEVEVVTIDGFQRTGSLLYQDVRQAIRDLAGAQDQQSLFNDYVIARIDAKDARGKESWKRIETAAARLPPAPLANEFLAYLLEDADMKMEALNAFRREGEQPDAKHAREQALDLALDMKETRSLREMMAIDSYRREISGWHQHEIGSLIGDWWMSITGLVRTELEGARLDELLLALLAAWLWYAVFLRFLKDVPRPKLWPLPMIIAGIASVVPTLYLLRHQEQTLGFVENGTFPNDLIYYVCGVGLREELSKLLLFALFVPLLLRYRSTATALLAGAFVGLGFAFEENLSYYQHSGFGAVIARLLTANFMHAAMTALTGEALYELVRTRFGSAERFIINFVGVVIVHGIYDWAIGAGQTVKLLQGAGYFSMLILAFLAQRFFDELHQRVIPKRGALSLMALFSLGMCSLVAFSMLLSAYSTRTLESIGAVGISASSLVPIAFFYLRRFAHS